MSSEAARAIGADPEALGIPENRFTVYLPDPDQAAASQTSAEYTDVARPPQPFVLPPQSYSGFMITHENLQQLQATVDQLPSDIRKQRLVSLAGLAGLALAGLTIRYDPHVAVTASEHLERSGVDIAAIGGGLGGIGAVLTGVMLASDLKAKLEEHRSDLKNIRWLIDNGRIDPDQPTYFFKWDKKLTRGKPNTSVRY